MHVVNRLYAAEFDFPKTDQKLSYMIAAVPRSGSTYFAIQLWRTGLLGAPMEYLNFPVVANQLMPRFGIPKDRALSLKKHEIVAYWNNVKKKRTSPNGVFGYKVFMINFRDLVNQYPDLFDNIQPDYVLHLTRRDRIEQAISYSKAKQTNAWFADMPNSNSAKYDFEHIRKCLGELDLQYDYWERVFAHAGIEPIRVAYEDLMSNEEETIASVLRQMNMEPDPTARLKIPLVRKQRGAETEDWRGRFEEDLRSSSQASV